MKSEQKSEITELEEIKDLLRFLVKQKISEKLIKMSKTEKKIYELTGEKGQTAIVKSLNVAPNTVSNLWKKMELEGILIKAGKSYKKVV